ncbi:hypothetical protein BH10PAT4_BH10PAT4_0610 [soil metagenome]
MQDNNEETPNEVKASPTTRKGVFQANYLVYYILGVVESLLILRLIFKLLGANPGSGFVSFIYSVSGFFLAPFTSIFPVATGEGVVTTSVLEPAVIVALIVYALIAWGISALVKALIVGKE